MGSPRWRRNQRLKCGCGGYWFPHRKGGGACESSKTRNIHLAVRTKDPELIAQAKFEHAIANGVHVLNPTEGAPF